MKDTPHRRQEDHATELRFRAARAIREHPWWSGSVVAGLIPVGATALVGLIGWAFGFVDTVSAAKAREAELEKRILRQEKQSAGVLMTLLDGRVLVARNRVNDCNIQRQGGRPMSGLEMNACFQYDSDYAEAKRRYEEAATQAQKTWREQ